MPFAFFKNKIKNKDPLMLSTPLMQHITLLCGHMYIEGKPGECTFVAIMMIIIIKIITLCYCICMSIYVHSTC